MNISAGTTRKSTRDKRRTLLRTLLDGGYYREVERLRRGELTWGDVEAALRSGDHASLARTGNVPTVGEACERVLEIVKGKQAPTGTLKAYRTDLKLLCEHFGFDALLTDIDQDAASAFLYAPKSSNKGRAWSPRRQHRFRAHAGRVWNDMMKAGRVTANPWRHVEPPEIVQTRTVFLLPEQWRRLRDATAGTPSCAYFALGVLAGLRQQEKAHLRPGLDVDMERGVVRVQSRDGEHPWRPKNKRGQRDVPMSAELRSILAAHIRAGFSGERFLLLHDPRQDIPLPAYRARLWTQEGYAAAGLPYGRGGQSMTDHQQRHTFASWLVQRDVQLMKVAALLGDTVDMVTTTYGHLLPQDMERAVRVLDEVVTE